MTSRPTWAEINLDAVAFNARQMQQVVGERTQLFAVVKANAYGHGMLPVVKTLLSVGVSTFCVASVDEGMELRTAGIDAPVLVLSATLPEESAAIVAHDLTPTVSSLEVAESLNEAAEQAGKALNVHVKVDTGMGRFGVWHEEAETFIARVTALPHLRLQGVLTHYASAEEDDLTVTIQQTHYFAQLRERLLARWHVSTLARWNVGTLERWNVQTCQPANLSTCQPANLPTCQRANVPTCQPANAPTFHAANSAAALRLAASHFDAIRPGLALYGVSPFRSSSLNSLPLRPAMSLKTRLVFLKQVPAGRALSYGGTHVTSQPTTIAILPLGYADGYPRALSNRGVVLVRGRRCPVVGRVTMDSTLIDVGAIDGVRVGEEAVIFGEGLPVEEVATLANTIPYEILCGIRQRVPRVYTSSH
ncbi:MAG: alanine racemase [Abditibacteriales bacterium]|nr:alanine racemase [Abditibacteriales bacterium]MDW8365106.1 alanine racemase [Abditibacteriales bacterium]